MAVSLSSFLSPERVACGLSVSSKKRALEQLSELIAGDRPSLSPGEVFDTLLARERLGGTGLGHGVAIPHGRLRDNPSTIGAVLLLKEGVDFDAVDGQPVDLIFALLIPEESTEEHLEILSLLAGMFSDREFVARLRRSESAQALYDAMIEWQAKP